MVHPALGHIVDTAAVHAALKGASLPTAGTTVQGSPTVHPAQCNWCTASDAGCRRCVTDVIQHEFAREESCASGLACRRDSFPRRFPRVACLPPRLHHARAIRFPSASGGVRRLRDGACSVYPNLLAEHIDCVCEGHDERAGESGVAVLARAQFQDSLGAVDVHFDRSACPPDASCQQLPNGDAGNSCAAFLVSGIRCSGTDQWIDWRQVRDGSNDCPLANGNEGGRAEDETTEAPRLLGSASLLGEAPHCIWVSDMHFQIQLGYRAQLSATPSLAFNVARLVYTKPAAGPGQPPVVYNGAFAVEPADNPPELHAEVSYPARVSRCMPSVDIDGRTSSGGGPAGLVYTWSSPNPSVQAVRPT